MQYVSDMNVNELQNMVPTTGIKQGHVQGFSWEFNMKLGQYVVVPGTDTCVAWAHNEFVLYTKLPFM